MLEIPEIRRPLFRSLDIFNKVAPCTPVLGLPDFHVFAPESRHVFGDLSAIAAHTGLGIVPAEKQMLTERLSADEHPTHFLQFGWATDHRRQAALEIGDDRALLSLHFRRQTGRDKDAPWHLDSLEIDDGTQEDGLPILCNLFCDDESHDGHIGQLFGAVSGAVALLRAGEWRGARETLHGTLTPVLQALDTESIVAAMDHEDEFRAKYGEVQNPPKRRLGL